VPSRLPAQSFALSRTAALQTNGGDSVVSVTTASYEQRAEARDYFSDSLALDRERGGQAYFLTAASMAPPALARSSGVMTG
jgi:hypothetical protein